MGQKVNPISLRLGIIRSWDSLWYADKEYGEYLHQDLKIREFVLRKLSAAGVGRVKVERLAKKVRVLIYVARPGVVLGKKGDEIQKVQKFIENFTSMEVAVDVKEIRKADSHAVLIANNIARQIEKRVSYKKAMKRAIDSAMKAGAQGVKIGVSGRLGGAEIARSEWYKEGRIPLHTLRADVCFGYAIAHTTYGTIGIKVWIYSGDKGNIEY
jgi:small subunit ribosomal protein S3